MNLKQLSASLNLSQTTVSRALNGFPEVSEATRRRVRDAAAVHGYRPNPSARRLATGAGGTIGHVMPTDESVSLDLHFVEFLSGLGDFARGHGLDLALSPTALADEDAAYRRIAAHRQADALYLSAPVPGDPRVPLLQSLGLPFIVHGRADGLACPYPFLDIDNTGAFFAATRMLISLGHRRVGLINGDRRQTFAIHREKGFGRALAQAGVAPDPDRVFSLPMTEENGFRAARDLLGRAGRPTALVCSSLVMALGVVRAAAELGLAIPRDLSLVAHDDVFAWLKPENFAAPLTTTRSSIRAAGARVAERLLARIEGRETGTQGEVWPVDLIARASTAPPWPG